MRIDAEVLGHPDEPSHQREAQQQRHAAIGDAHAEIHRVWAEQQRQRAEHQPAHVRQIMTAEEAERKLRAGDMATPGQPGGHLARKERDGRGDVRRARIDAGDEQCRKSEERAAAGQRVLHAGGERGEDEEQQGPGHRRRFAMAERPPLCQRLAAVIGRGFRAQ